MTYVNQKENTMTEIDARSLKKGELILYRGEECEVLRIHKSPVLVECKSIGQNHRQWHLVRPGPCRMK